MRLLPRLGSGGVHGYLGSRGAHGYLGSWGAHGYLVVLPRALCAVAGHLVWAGAGWSRTELLQLPTVPLLMEHSWGVRGLGSSHS